MILHEMDAIYRKEWKMFAVLNKLPEKTAYLIFSLFHLPLFLIIFYLMQTNFNLIFLVLNYFLIIHTFIHWLLKKHPGNNFRSGYSNVIITLMGVIAFLSLILRF